MLESRTFFRVGGAQPIKVDVRVVAATNRPLRDAVALGEFRDDLYYRLNVLNIYLPPLRERREDIPLLVRRFIREFARTHDRTFRGITPEAMQRLVNAPWPGNVRQLRNLIESHGGAGARAPRSGPPTSRPTSWRARGRCCRCGSRRAAGAGRAAGRSWSSSSGACSSSSSRWRSCGGGWTTSPSGSRSSTWATTPRWPTCCRRATATGTRPVVYRPGMTMAEVEKAAIEAALQEYRGNRRRAAEVLGIGERTLYRKIKAYQLE